MVNAAFSHSDTLVAKSGPLCGGPAFTHNPVLSEDFRLRTERIPACYKLMLPIRWKSSQTRPSDAPSLHATGRTKHSRLSRSDRADGLPSTLTVNTVASGRHVCASRTTASAQTPTGSLSRQSGFSPCFLTTILPFVPVAGLETMRVILPCCYRPIRADPRSKIVHLRIASQLACQPGRKILTYCCILTIALPHQNLSGQNGRLGLGICPNDWGARPETPPPPASPAPAMWDAAGRMQDILASGRRNMSFITQVLILTFFFNIPEQNKPRIVILLEIAGCKMV